MMVWMRQMRRWLGCFAFTFGHSGARVPSLGDTLWDIPSDTPVFRDIVGETPWGILRARRARKTLGVGRRDAMLFSGAFPVEPRYHLSPNDCITAPYFLEIKFGGRNVKITQKWSWNYFRTP